MAGRVAPCLSDLYREWCVQVNEIGALTLRAKNHESRDRRGTMSKRNTLTVAGRRLLDQVEQVDKDLGECESGRLNDAVTALAATVRALILNSQPLWESVEE